MAGNQPLPNPRPATADLLSSLEDLELSNRRLAGENAKLQRSVETAEEGSARLGEEISALRKQLRRWALRVLSLHLLPCLRPCTVPFCSSSFSFVSPWFWSLSLLGSDSLLSSSLRLHISSLCLSLCSIFLMSVMFPLF